MTNATRIHACSALLALLSACPGDDSPTNEVSTCDWPAALDDAGAGACRVGHGLFDCSLQGTSCGGVADDVASLISECQLEGLASRDCKNQCHTDEYALSCGGPPRMDNVSYADAPANCRVVSSFPSGAVQYCCPCT